MPDADWTDLIATDPTGEPLGRVEDVYVDAETREPRFALLSTPSLGGLRHRRVLVPAGGARERAGTVELPYPADRVREAPDEGDRAHRLDAEREREVLAFFGDAGAGAPVDAPADVRGDADGAASVVLHEERMAVGWRTREVERLRIRKVIVEEEVTVKVRLRREELRVDREPIDAEVAGRSAGHLEADELPPDLILYGEEPVVEARVVPMERVRFSRGIVTQREVVTGTVRREDARVEVQAAGTPVVEREDLPAGGSLGREPGRTAG